VGHLDAEKEFIVPEAPTLSHLSLRVIVSVAVQNEWPLWTKDVTMAYLQSASPLSRAVYIRSPRSPILVREQLHKHVLRVSKPLYGLIDSGSYWFNTYTQAFQGIRTKPTALDECLMYRVCTDSNTLDGLAGIQVDDTLMLRTNAFRADETAMRSQFDL
jgi:Reverse transcriptase (RNA-dependent DNA polymerase)